MRVRESFRNPACRSAFIDAELSIVKRFVRAELAFHKPIGLRRARRAHGELCWIPVLHCHLGRWRSRIEAAQSNERTPEAKAHGLPESARDPNRSPRGYSFRAILHRKTGECAMLNPLRSIHSKLDLI